MRPEWLEASLAVLVPEKPAPAKTTRMSAGDETVEVVAVQQAKPKRPRKGKKPVAE